jgi:hypothetical protein
VATVASVVTVLVVVVFGRIAGYGDLGAGAAVALVGATGVAGGVVVRA